MKTKMILCVIKNGHAYVCMDDVDLPDVFSPIEKVEKPEVDPSDDLTGIITVEHID